MTPYTDIVLDHAIELLQAYSAEEVKDPGLWTQILLVFQKSFDYDQGAYWTDEHLAKLLPHLTEQLPFASSLTTTDASSSSSSEVYPTTLASFAGTTSSPSLLKSLNHAILMHTRSAEAEIRTLALEVTAAVWSRAGEDMLELVPQAVSDLDRKSVV